MNMKKQPMRIYSIDNAVTQINSFEVEFLKAVQALIEDYDAVTTQHQAMKYPANSNYVMRIHQITASQVVLPEWEFRGKVLSAMWDYLMLSGNMKLSGHTFSVKTIQVVFL